MFYIEFSELNLIRNNRMNYARKSSKFTNGRSNELLARRWIEDQGFVVHDANVVFGMNCPNIDLIVYNRHGAIFVQTKSSTLPATKNGVIIDGSPWTETQLSGVDPIFNKHDHYRANFVVLVDAANDEGVKFYVAPPHSLEKLMRKAGNEFYKKLKKDGTQRSIRFRKELPRDVLGEWYHAWQLLGEPP